jgi:hypothetical protein
LSHLYLEGRTVPYRTPLRSPSTRKADARRSGSTAPTTAIGSSRKSARSGDELLEPSRYGVATIPSANVWRSPAPYPLRPSRFFDVLTGAVLESGRWEKWLQPDEPEDFDQLSAERRHWLVTSGARYVWTDPRVIEARSLLYDNLTSVMTDPDGWVVERIATSIERYVRAFNLFGSAGLLATNAADKGT